MEVTAIDWKSNQDSLGLQLAVNYVADQSDGYFFDESIGCLV